MKFFEVSDMVKIEIDDELWRLYKKSWVLFDVKTEDKVIVMLEDSTWRSTVDAPNGTDKKLAWSLYCKRFGK
jgi:hypothetical protein